MADHGVPPQTVSNMSKFESADPGYWCRKGYAVANVDPRGIGHSEGDFVQFGSQDGKDGYDFIEWAAAQPWCSGRCALSGNSCVAMTQWRIAAQQPPHLACIAPWEGTGDLYRESLYEGGIPATTFVGMVNREAVGPNYIDNTAENAKKYPFADCDYWQDKIPGLEKDHGTGVCDRLLESFPPQGIHDRLPEDEVQEEMAACAQEF